MNKQKWNGKWWKSGTKGIFAEQGGLLGIWNLVGPLFSFHFETNLYLEQRFIG
ncbi:hypothetical protein HAX54_007714, partial [Datura stramonium]|nr:hypothetical protein [Datura stramonium]